MSNRSIPQRKAGAGHSRKDRVGLTDAGIMKVVADNGTKKEPHSYKNRLAEMRRDSPPLAHGERAGDGR